MRDLPKRIDYKEIESFEPYELTQCVAYEMAIRSAKEFIKKIDRQEIISKVSLYESDKVIFYPYEAMIDSMNNNAEWVSYIKLIGEMIERYWLCYNRVKSYKQNNRLPAKLKNLKWSDAQVHLTLEDYQYQFNEFCKKSSIKFNGKIYIGKVSISDFINRVSNDAYSFYQSKTKRNDEGIREDTLYNNVKIEENFKRPKLLIPKDLKKDIELVININLPKAEIFAYIERIKNDYDKDNSIIKTPIELLGETLNEATQQKNYPKKPTALKMADMFFIYDYIKARQDYIEEENKSNEAKFEIEIEDIKKYHIGKDRKSRVAYAKAEYLESTLNTNITDIFKEDELTEPLSLSHANISKLYYAIKPYIDDLKYKELITGVRTI